MQKISFLFFTIIISVLSSVVFAQPITGRQIDSITYKTLSAFDVPGIAVAVVKDGKIIHAKGYGVRSLDTKLPVDEHTLFGIASNSKAFTTAALGMLIDQKKLTWNTRVTDIIPEFKLYAPYVTENFTVRDLITHRSGLGLGAGDLMIWPDSNLYTLKDLIYNLRFLKQVSDFRTKYDYDNLLFVVAGEIVHRVSGMKWEDFIEKNIMDPLGMNESAGSYSRLKNKSNVIDAHAPVDGKVQVIHRDWDEKANAAGGIYSNLTDMSKWAIMQMDDGKYGPGNDKQLFSTSVHNEMWTPQTIIPVSSPNMYNTHFKSYGLGWFLSDEMGYKIATHTGGLAGIVTQVTLIPEMKLGIIVFTNQQSGAAFTSITNSIKDAYFGIKGKNRIQENVDRVGAMEKNARQVTDEVSKQIALVQNSKTEKPDYNSFTGKYNDPWFGDIVISLKDNKLWMQSQKSPRLKGEMFYYKGNTFIVRWDDRGMDADCYLLFGMDFNGKPESIKMEPISPLTDFSFDFQDLNFTKTN